MAKCKVCDAAPGCQRYGSWACPACAVFFRRFVLHPKQYTCKFQDDCGKSGREFLLFRCQACRLKRCLGAGMKADRVKKHCPSETYSSSSDDVTPPPKNTPFFAQTIPAAAPPPPGPATTCNPFQISHAAKTARFIWAMFVEDLITTVIQSPILTSSFISRVDTQLLVESRKRFEARTIGSTMSQRLELWAREIGQHDLSEHEFRCLCDVVVLRVAVFCHKLTDLTKLGMFAEAIDVPAARKNDIDSLCQSLLSTFVIF